MLSLNHIAIIFAVIISALAAISSYTGLLQEYDHLILDNSHKWQKPLAADDIIIIAIDENSIEKIGHWPWPRSVHAKLVDTLASYNVKTIIFDILFAEENPNDPIGDQQFAQSLNRQNNSSTTIVLPIFLGQEHQFGITKEMPPADIFYRQGVTIGHAHVNCDSDGICRSVFLKEGVGSPYWPHIALAPLAMAENEEQLPGQRASHINAMNTTSEQLNPSFIYRDYHNYLPFPPSHTAFKTASYNDVIAQRLDAKQFSGKTVFIGGTATGLGDVLATPTGLMPGVFLHAIIHQGLKNNRLIRSLSNNKNALITAAVSFTALLVLLHLSPLLFLLGSVGTIVGVMTSGIALLRTQLVWVPTSSIVMAVIIFYPLWGWLKIHAAYNYLKKDLAKINNDINQQKSLFRPQKTQGEKKGGLFFSSMDSIEKTIRQLQNVNQTLHQQRFIIDKTLDQLNDAVLVTNLNGRILLSNKMANAIFNIQDNTEINLTNLIQSSTSTYHQEWKDYTHQLIQHSQPSTHEIFLDISTPNIEHNTEQRRYFYCNALKTNFDNSIIDKTLLNHVKVGNIKITPPTPIPTQTPTLVLTFTDVTQLKKAEESRLDTLNFLSHDLRSPMVSILALISNMRSGANKESTESNLRKISRYAEQNLEYAEAILQLSKAEAATNAIFYPVDIHDIVDTAYYNTQEQAKNRNINLHLYKQDEDMWVNGDADLLTRSVQNMITNAIKYCQTNSTVHIRAQLMNQSSGLTPNTVCISITDNGPGIAEEQQKTLFQRYKKGTKATSTGVGLGLFFVKTVAEKHQGTISLESSNTQGTCFTLRLPALKE